MGALAKTAAETVSSFTLTAFTSPGLRDSRRMELQEVFRTKKKKKKKERKKNDSNQLLGTTGRKDG
jgi:hypothetical protein